MNEENLVWEKIHGVFTGGGDPAWKCPICGKGEHVYGIEHIYEWTHKCKDCGTEKIYYPWEKDEEEEI